MVEKSSPPRMKAILRLLEQTGMRENEAVTLEALDVSWQTQPIRLTRTKTGRPRTLDWRAGGRPQAWAAVPSWDRRRPQKLRC
jgi:integrase/recombinase XerD